MRETMSILYPQKMKGSFPSDEDLPGFEEKCISFMKKAHAVSETVQRCLALGLGYDEDYFIPVQTLSI